MNANSNLVEVINAYETVKLTAKEKKSVEDSLERLRQDCDRGISIVSSLSQALAVLQPEDIYLPDQPPPGPTGASRELGLFCTVLFFLSDSANTYRLSTTYRTCTRSARKCTDRFLNEYLLSFAFPVGRLRNGGNQ
jgi:hypothetical protein